MISSGVNPNAPEQTALALGAPSRPEVTPPGVRTAVKQSKPSAGLERVAAAIAHVKQKHETKIALLAPRLNALAFSHGDWGVDSSDTRRLALQAGIITGEEKGRQLSWLAAVPRRAQLYAAGYREEFNAQGNRPMRYVHEVFATDAVKQRAQRKRGRRAA